MDTELKDAIAAAFSRRLRDDSFLQTFLERLQKSGVGGLTLEDVQKYAEHLGQALSNALLDVVGPDAYLRDNKHIRRDAFDRLLRPLLDADFKAIQSAANKVQKAIDAADGIGLNGVDADFPEDRASGLVDKLVESESGEAAQSWLGEPVVNFHMHSYDKWVRANADFRYKAGMSPKIVRKGHPGMCPWCAALAGTYDYESVRYGADVWRRHQHCRCTVTYVNGGTRQDVWSKKVWQAAPETLEARKTLHREIFKGPVENGLANSRKSAIISSRSVKEVKPETLNLPDEIIGRSVGAKARNYDILDLRTGDMYRLAEGSRLQDIQVFAGKGTRVKFRDADKYAERYGGDAKDWQHVKGRGLVDTPEGDRPAELHWVQCEGIGKQELFVKRWLDDES